MTPVKLPHPIYVTQPLLPELKDFLPYLEMIWENKILTNGGPFHQQLEQALCEYLGVKHICLFTNGTLALMTALQALRITGEVITTPYSFVATAHSLLWNGIKPVFVDIDPQQPEHGPGQYRGGHHAANDRHHACPLLRATLRRRTHRKDCRQLWFESHLRRGARIRRAPQRAAAY